MEFRHENKFIVSNAQLELIRYRISPLMKRDRNQKDGFYTITSLYFDDINDRCLNENLNGDDRRDKYRIRIYNNDFQCIKLEKKSKVHGMTRKISVLLDREECKLMVLGKIPYEKRDLDSKKQRLFCEMQMCGLRPTSIVEYERTAFINRVGNVRITFDRNIRGSHKVSDFLKSQINMCPLLGQGAHILEVKYDELLPSYIYESLEINSLQQTAFSKYAYSRR